MRTFKFVSLFMIVAMLLAACGGAAAPGAAARWRPQDRRPGPALRACADLRRLDARRRAARHRRVERQGRRARQEDRARSSRTASAPLTRRSMRPTRSSTRTRSTTSSAKSAPRPRSRSPRSPTPRRSSRSARPRPTPTVTVGKDGKAKDYIFRACFIDPFQGKVGAKFALGQPEGQERLHHVSTRPTTTSRAWPRSSRRRSPTGGGKIVGKENYTANGHRLLRHPRRRSPTPSPTWSTCPTTTTSSTWPPSRPRKRASPPRSWAAMAGIPRTWTKAAAAGGYFTNHYSPDDPRPEVQNFLKAFTATSTSGATSRTRWRPWPTTPPTCCCNAHQGCRRRRHRQGEGCPRQDHLRRRLRQDHLRRAAQPDQVGDHPGGHGRTRSSSTPSSTRKPFVRRRPSRDRRLTSTRNRGWTCVRPPTCLYHTLVMEVCADAKGQCVPAKRRYAARRPGARFAWIGQGALLLLAVGRRSIVLVRDLLRQIRSCLPRSCSAVCNWVSSMR